MDSKTTSKATKFAKLSQREHVLHRPDMYAGSLTPEVTSHVVKNVDGEFVYKDVKIAPGFSR